MKHCSKCGNELMDEAVICPKCGCPTESADKPKKKKRKGLEILFIVFCVVMVLYVLGSLFGEDTPDIPGGADTAGASSVSGETGEWEFYEGTKIPTFDSAMDVPLYRIDGRFYMYDCGTSEDDCVEYMKLYADTVMTLGYDEVDSPLGGGVAIDTPNGTLIIVGTEPTADGHYIVLVYFDET